MKRKDTCSKKWSIYSDICGLLNLLTTLLMTVGSGFIIHFIGLDIILVIIGCFVLFWVFAWIEEHYLSRFINAAVEKIMKVDIKSNKGK
jgi:uncharacterized membrane protein